MLNRKIKKIFHGALSLLVVFMVSFLGTSAANGNISLDSLTNGISRLVAMGENQLSETAAEGSKKLSDNNLIDKIETIFPASGYWQKVRTGEALEEYLDACDL